MANRLRTVRSAAAALFLGAVGCAFPNGNTGGDPLLGNFNRPIVPTPPPERGGLGPDTPAYDGGARIGVGATDVPGRAETLPAPKSTPAAGTPTIPGTPGAPGATGSPMGARLPLGGSDETSFDSRPATGGAKLRTPADVVVREPAAPTVTPAVAETTGPSLPPLRQASHEERIDPSQPQTIDSAHALLQKAGAREMRTEQTADGEWIFSCSRGDELYEGRGPDALQAMCLVLETMKKGQ